MLLRADSRIITPLWAWCKRKKKNYRKTKTTKRKGKSFIYEVR